MSRKEDELKEKLLAAYEYTEILNIINQMVANKINPEKHVMTTVYRNLILKQHKYNEFNEIKKISNRYKLEVNKGSNKTSCNKRVGTINNTFHEESIVVKPVKVVVIKRIINGQITKTKEDERLNIPFVKDGLDINKVSLGCLNPKRTKIMIGKINRSQILVSRLKKLYDNSCQICSLKLSLGYGKFYSEVHHIQPLGLHKGPDIEENMIVLCPNHHLLFDKGAITIDIDNNRILHHDINDSVNNNNLNLKHRINKKYIDYHNKNIFIGNKPVA